jgi:hypothetical protein
MGSTRLSTGIGVAAIGRWPRRGASLGTIVDAEILLRKSGIVSKASREVVEVLHAACAGGE